VVPKPPPDWVALTPRFTPGWPWPEDSYGLDPMYGEDGWCQGCGMPLVEQTGPLFMQGSKFPRAEVWTPSWLFDVVCVSAQLATSVAERFALDFKEVHKPRTGPAGAMQMLPTRTSEPWHRPDELAQAIRARHSEFSDATTGSTCPLCGRWKWLPIGEQDAPVKAASVMSANDLIASPEVFGSGLSSFRHLLFRRPLGEILVSASPRNWDLVEVVID